jgi:alpha-1,6-mannosyltransferase
MKTILHVTGLAASGALLLLLAGVGAESLRHWQNDAVVRVMLASAVVYAAAVWLVWRHEAQRPAATQKLDLRIILATAVLARCVLVTAPPMSTDIYRYVWDGRVQAAGINPYRYRPAERPVAFLRDAEVYPNINRADTAVTIYPPMAQMIFLGVTRIANSVTGMKAAMVGFELLIVVVLLALLRSRGLPETRIILYAWHPLPLFEFAGSGHIDAAAIALMLLACLMAERKHPLTGGALLGGAALVKFFPAAIAPALYQRWGWRFPVALLAAAGLLYLPYLGVGWHVFGFLPRYAEEEGLTTGQGFFWVSALGRLFPLPDWATAAYLILAAAILTCIALAVVRRRDPTAVSMSAALALLLVFTLIASPHLAWYFTWVIPFLCFRPSWALIYLSSAAPLLYALVWTPDLLLLNAALYVPFGLIFVAETWRNCRRLTLEYT